MPEAPSILLEKGGAPTHPVYSSYPIFHYRQKMVGWDTKIVATQRSGYYIVHFVTAKKWLGGTLNVKSYISLPPNVQDIISRISLHTQ